MILLRKSAGCDRRRRGLALARHNLSIFPFFFLFSPQFLTVSVAPRNEGASQENISSSGLSPACRSRPSIPLPVCGHERNSQRRDVLLRCSARLTGPDLIEFHFRFPDTCRSCFEEQKTTQNEKTTAKRLFKSHKRKHVLKLMFFVSGELK